jgi:hypothetical protein
VHTSASAERIGRLTLWKSIALWYYEKTVLVFFLVHSAVCRMDIFWLNWDFFLLFERMSPAPLSPLTIALSQEEITFHQKPRLLKKCPRNDRGDSVKAVTVVTVVTVTVTVLVRTVVSDSCDHTMP